MRIVIGGIGSIGHLLATRLAELGHDVTAIDTERNALSGLDDEINSIVGDICDPDVLESAEIRGATCFISTTADINTNLIASCIAKKMFSVSTSIVLCKTLTNKHLELFFKENFDVDYFIESDMEIAKMLFDISMLDSVYYYTEMNGVSVLELPCVNGSDIANTSIRHLKNVVPDIDMLIVHICRNGESISLPNANDSIKVGDIVYVACKKVDVNAVVYAFGIKHILPKIAIAGVNSTTKMLMEKLCDRGYKVVAIDDSKDELLDIQCNADMIYLENLNASSIAEIQLKDVTTFIAATDNEERNALMSITASAQGVNRTISITKSNEGMHIPVRSNVVINRADAILQMVLGVLHVRNNISITNTNLTFVMLQINEDSSLIGRNVNDSFHKDVSMPLFIINGGRIENITHNSILQNGQMLALAKL